MELTPSLMYWITRLDLVSELLKVISLVASVAAAMGGSFYVAGLFEAETKKQLKFLTVAATAIAAVAFAGLVLIPTTKDIYVIYGLAQEAGEGGMK